MEFCNIELKVKKNDTEESEFYEIPRVSTSGTTLEVMDQLCKEHLECLASYLKICAADVHMEKYLESLDRYQPIMMKTLLTSCVEGTKVRLSCKNAGTMSRSGTSDTRDSQLKAPAKVRKGRGQNRPYLDLVKKTFARKIGKYVGTSAENSEKIISTYPTFDMITNSPTGRLGLITSSLKRKADQTGNDDMIKCLLLDDMHEAAELVCEYTKPLVKRDHLEAFGTSDKAKIREQLRNGNFVRKFNDREEKKSRRPKKSRTEGEPLNIIHILSLQILSSIFLR